jgi:hypothetical protein
MTTILPIYVLKHIQKYVSEPYIVYLDKENGSIIKQYIHSKIEMIIDNTLYNHCKKQDIMSITYQHHTYSVKLRTHSLFLINNEWIKSSYNNIIQHNNWSKIHHLYISDLWSHNNLFFGYYFDEVICYNYGGFRLYDMDKQQFTETIQVQLNHEMRAYYNYYGYALDYKHCYFTIDSFIGNINNNGHSINIYWVSNSNPNSPYTDPKWKLIIAEKYNIKTYTFVSGFGSHANTFIMDNKIIIVYGYKIILCQIHHSDFELEFIKSIDIPIDYDTVFMNDNLLTVYLYSQEEHTVYYCDLDSKTEHFTSISTIDIYDKFIKISSDNKSFDFYINEANQYKENKYKNYMLGK